MRRLYELNEDFDTVSTLYAECRGRFTVPVNKQHTSQ